MRIPFSTVIALALATALSPAAAQQTIGAQPQPPALPTPIADWMTPIHGQPADPLGGEYGLWAAGPDYKVSFDDGFAFYPLLGEAYPENLPLRWRTDTIAVGTKVLVDRTSPVRLHHEDWRFELRYPGVTEAYDVRRDGVEQTFVLHSRPAGEGDLVVAGRLETPLQAATVPEAHQSLQFTDDQGRPLVVYGEAFAFDAVGQRIDVTTSFDGGVVRLRLPADWVRAAQFPITIDPLTSRARIPANGTPNNGIPSYPNVARDDLNNQILVTYSRASAGSDHDMWARLRNDNMTGITRIFSDITATWSTRHTSVAHVQGGADKWAVAFGRNFANSSAIRVYVHDGGNTTPDSGTTMFLNAPAGSQDQHPSVGGNAAIALDGHAYMAFRRDVGAGAPNSANSEVFGVVVDVRNGTFGTPRNLHTSSVNNYDAEWPCVTAEPGRTGSWVVVWQEFNYANSSDDWDVVGQRVRRNGILAGYAVFGHSGTSSRHKLHPMVAGSGGRYMVSYLMRDNASSASSLRGDTIAVQRFDWSESSSAPTKQSPQTVASTASNSLRASVTNRSIAYDTNTDSHWAVVYRTTGNDVIAAKCGYTGRVLESATVFAHASIAGISPAVCYNNDDYEFSIVYGTNEAPENPLYGLRLQYYSDVAATAYGSRCPGTLSAFNRGPNDLPYAGSEFFGLEMTGGVPNALTGLFVSLNGGLGALPGGCPLSLDLMSTVTYVSGVSDAAGTFRVDIPLPDTIDSLTLHWQAIQLEGGTRVHATNGLRTVIH